MSAYTSIRTRLVSREHLARALRELGFDQVEVHDAPVTLIGIGGEQRQSRAEVVIRRVHIGRLSNDIGFVRDSQGFFQALVSEYDQDRFGTPWLMKLNQRYAYAVAREQLHEQGFELIEEQLDERETMRLTLRRAV